VLVLSLVAFAIAAAIHGSFHAFVPTGAQVVPLLAALPWAFALLGMVAMVVSAVVTIGRADGVGPRLALVALHVFVGIAGPVGTATSDPSFPFGPSHVGDLDLPGDRGRAYLYRGGIFCAQDVWIAAPGQWVAFEHRELGSYTCEREGTLRWDDALQQVRVVDGHGDALPSPPWAGGMAEGLSWGPH
jgi:hypothetical protein